MIVMKIKMKKKEEDDEEELVEDKGEGEEEGEGEGEGEGEERGEEEGGEDRRRRRGGRRRSRLVGGSAPWKVGSCKRQALIIYHRSFLLIIDSFHDGRYVRELSHMKNTRTAVNLFRGAIFFTFCNCS